MSLSKISQLAPAYNLTIIGGGFSGTLLAVQLLKLATAEPDFPALHLRLIDPNSKVGPGLAYGICEPCHLLNTPVNRMSAFPDAPLDFWQWLTRHSVNPPNPTDFVPRQLYGRYLEAILSDSLAALGQSERAGQVRFERIESAVTAIEPGEAGAGGFLHLADGQTLYTDRAVLALGSLEPGNPPLDDSSFYDSSHYCRTLWQAGALDDLDPQAEVLLIGSGLSAIDGVLSLQARRHQGTIHLISRRGLLPQVHHPALVAATAPAYTPLTPAYQALFQADISLPTSIHQLYRVVRQEIEAAEGVDSDWRMVIDRLRPLLPRLWAGLPPTERGRFLRHLRPYWEVHRHRVAPQIAQVVRDLQAAGQLVLHTGRVVAYEPTEDGVTAVCRLRYRPQLLRLPVARVLNCTGPSLDYTATRQPLLRQLTEAGLVRPGPLGMGLETDQVGRLIGEGDRAETDFLYTLGPARVGQLWETTAVPELRVQARDLARHLLAQMPVAIPE